MNTTSTDRFLSNFSVVKPELNDSALKGVDQPLLDNEKGATPEGDFLDRQSGILHEGKQFMSMILINLLNIF